MKRILLLLTAAPIALIACAQVLSYDDYKAREADAGPIVDSADTAETLVETGVDLSHPPTRPAGEAKASGKGRTLWIAAKHIYIGGQTSLGVSGPDAWKEWGFDLDNVCTTLEDSIKNVGTCRRPLEAKQDFLVDGFDCRDNNFGHHVVALLNLTSEGFEQRVNEGIFTGTSTWIIRIDDLDDGPDDPYAPAKLYRAAGEKGAVKWDGTDVRKVVAESVVGGDLEKSISEFKKGFVRNNVWVSGEPEKRDLLLPGSTAVVLTLPLDASVFTVKLNADHRGGTRGVVAGALPVAAIETLIRPIATESGFCPGTSLYNSLLRTVQRFPDVVVGAPGLQNTAVECDGISLGMGFDVVPVQPVTQIVPGDPPSKDMCDAGVDGG